jgi:putative oxidoreductase
MTTTTVSGSPAGADIRAAAGDNDSILAIGRILIASKGLPYPNILAVLTANLETGGGLLIIVGWQTRLAALALAIFSAVAAYYFHDFWNQTGPQHTNNMIHFMKNVSIIGGLLMLCAVGAGRYSLNGPCINFSRSSIVPSSPRRDRNSPEALRVDSR